MLNIVLIIVCIGNYFFLCRSDQQVETIDLASFSSVVNSSRFRSHSESCSAMNAHSMTDKLQLLLNAAARLVSGTHKYTTIWTVVDSTLRLVRFDAVSYTHLTLPTILRV